MSNIPIWVDTGVSMRGMPKGDCRAFTGAPVIGITDDCQPIFALPGGIETTNRCWNCDEPFSPRPSNVAKQRTCGKESCQRTYANRNRPNFRAKAMSKLCAICGMAFKPHHPSERTCSAGACETVAKSLRWHRWAAQPGKAEHKGMRRETVLANLAQLLAQCARPEAFGVPAGAVAPMAAQPDGGPDPWTAPPPAWGGRLPGAVLPIDVEPRFGAPEKLGTALHAILTHLLREGRGHDPTRPEWSLLLVGEQTSSGWAVWLSDEADVELVRGKAFEAHLRCCPCQITLGANAALRLRPPRVEQVGRHRVRLTTITPVCMRALGADGRRYRSYPQTPTLWTALVTVAQRIGLTLPDPTAVGIVRVSHTTTPSSVTLNQGRGVVATAWSGDVVLDVNPLGRWLLEVAARIGLGGRTAYGLGRIAIRDEQPAVETAHPSPEPWEVVVDQAAEKFGARMGIPNDEARVALMALVETATFERETQNGCEMWRAGDVLLMTQPTTMRALRIVDVIFEEVVAPTVKDQRK